MGCDRPTGEFQGHCIATQHSLKDHQQQDAHNAQRRRSELRQAAHHHRNTEKTQDHRKYSGDPFRSLRAPLWAEQVPDRG